MLSKIKKKQEYDAAASDDEIFFQAVKETGDADDVVSTITEYESYMERSDCPPQIVDQYMDYCSQNGQWYSLTGFSDDRKMYNHAEIRDRMISSKRNMDKSKSIIIKMMEAFIANSIAPVSEK